MRSIRLLALSTVAVSVLTIGAGTAGAVVEGPKVIATPTTQPDPHPGPINPDLPLANTPDDDGPGFHGPDDFTSNPGDPGDPDDGPSADDSGSNSGSDDASVGAASADRPVVANPNFTG
jgi:hypothetical protein